MIKIFERLLTGKKPPEEIIVKARFNELKELIEKKFKIMKIIRVRAEYSRKIFIACLIFFIQATSMLLSSKNS